MAPSGTGLNVRTARPPTRCEESDAGGNARITFSPDGRHVACSDRDGATLKIWEAATGRLVAECERQSFRVVPALAFSPDGHTIASGSDTVRIWDVASGVLLATCAGPEHGVGPVGFHPDGRWIAAAVGHEVLTRNASTGALLESRWVANETVTAMAVCLDGRLVGGGCEDGSLTLWNAESDGPSTTVVAMTNR